MVAYVIVLTIARKLSRRRRAADAEGYRVLLTGTFQSENWAAAHLRPLARASRCASITVVSVTPVPDIDKVRVVAPAAWLVRLLGSVPARLVTFAWIALITRPHIVGGFHLLLNGLLAALLAPLAGARALYFCVGGPAEILGGGINGENRLFGRLETPDAQVERRLLQAVAAFDVVITMGSGAAQFLRDRGIRTALHVHPGGLESPTTPRNGLPAASDVLFVGRLAPIKRVDLFLEVVARVRAAMPEVRATIVGNGVLRGALEERARELELGHNVTFVGHQRDVSPWLAGARVFVLTSESEGLSLALLEAMQHGLPAVVPRVGDLGDAVEHGVNGYLVGGRTPEAFASRIAELLGDPDRRAQFGAAARQAAARFEMRAAVSRWDEILGRIVHGVPMVDPLAVRAEEAMSRARGR